MNFKRNSVRLGFAVLVCSGALMARPMVAQAGGPPDAAQEQGQGAPPPPMGGPGRGGPEHRLQMLQHELNLSADQTAQVKALFESEHSKMEAMRANSSATNEDRRAQMMAMHQDEDTKLRALLTPDQVTKYDAMQARMRQRMAERRQEGGDGPPPAPQQ